MAPSPMVSAEQVAAVTDAYLDRMADLARRLDVPAGQVDDVVRRAGLATIESCAHEPATVVDILGRWAANTRALANQAQTGTATGRPAAPSSAADAAAVSSGGEARTTAAVLAQLPEGRRLALLMRDSYDAPPIAVAVALGVPVDESEAVIAEGRLRLMEGINGRRTPTLAGHELIAGITLATLGTLADGSAVDTDPEVRLRRRHVGGCQTCAAILDVENRARVVMAGLPVLALPDSTRAPTLEALLAQASTDLPTGEEIEAAGVRAERVLPAAVVAMALALALIIGVGAGAILRHSKAAANLGPTPTSPGLILSSPTPTPTATPTTSPSPSPSATPSFLRSYSPTPAPTSARPSPTKAKPKKTASAKPTHRATRATPTSAAPTSAAPTPELPTSAAPTSAAPTPELPTSAAPTSAAPSSSSPTTNPPVG